MSQAPVALSLLLGPMSLPGSRLEPELSHSPVAQCVQTKRHFVSCVGSV